MAPRVCIVADHREEASGIPDLLAAMEGVSVTTQQLPVGDYLIEGRVLVERKTIADFAASVVDERLFHQAARLTRTAYRPALILEGTSAPQRPVPRHALQGALVSIALIFDIPILRSIDAPGSAQLLAYSARQLATTISRGQGVRRWKPKGLPARQLHVLTSLPGIGRGRAALLLSAFGSIEQVMAASETALAAVSGIGPKRAAAIRRLLSEPAAQPDDDTTATGLRP